MGRHWELLELVCGSQAGREPCVAWSCLQQERSWKEKEEGRVAAFIIPVAFSWCRNTVSFRERQTQTCITQPSAAATGIQMDEYVPSARS